MADDTEDQVKEPDTDAAGNANYNLNLSQHRAESVRDLLVNGGIAQAIISLFAFGE